MRSIRRFAAGLLTVVAVAGCQTRGENLPLEEARTRVIVPDVPERVPLFPPPPPPSPDVVRMGGGLWQPGFQQFNLPQRLVQPVGSAGGQTFYALSWDRQPFDRLLVQVPGRAGEFLEYLSVW